MNIFDNVARGVNDPSQTAEQDSANRVGEVAASLLGELLKSPAKPLFPQLSQAFGGLFDAIQPGQQFPSQTSSSPFSPAAAGIPSALFNNPSQLLDLLENASQKLRNGLAGANLAGPGTTEQEGNQAVPQAVTTGEPQDQLAAQQALLKMQVAVEQASTLMSSGGQE